MLLFYRDIPVGARLCDAVRFSGYVDKIIKVMSLCWVTNMGLIELDSKNPG